MDKQTLEQQFGHEAQKHEPLSRQIQLSPQRRQQLQQQVLDYATGYSAGPSRQVAAPLGPPPASMEEAMLNWAAGLLGFAPHGTTGQLAASDVQCHTAAMAAARDARGFNFGQLPRTRIFLTADAHPAIREALVTLGFEAPPPEPQAFSEAVNHHVQGNLVYVSMDGQGRIKPTALQRAVATEQDEGMLPWLVVANAGTYAHGVVDPVMSLVHIARRYGLWLHTDATYGGFFMLGAKRRHLFHGMAQAHSVVLNTQKGLMQEQPVSLLLRRLGEQDNATSLADATKVDEGKKLESPLLGMGLWFALDGEEGLAPYQAAIDEKVALTEWLGAKLRNHPEFELLEPQLAMLGFRHVPEHLRLKGDLENADAADFAHGFDIAAVSEYNQALAHSLAATNEKVFSALLHGEEGCFVRMDLLQPALHMQEVEGLWGQVLTLSGATHNAADEALIQHHAERLAAEPEKTEGIKGSEPIRMVHTIGEGQGTGLGIEPEVEPEAGQETEHGKYADVPPPELEATAPAMIATPVPLSGGVASAARPASDDGEPNKKPGKKKKKVKKEKKAGQGITLEWLTDAKVKKKKGKPKKEKSSGEKTAKKKGKKKQEEHTVALKVKTKAEKKKKKKGKGKKGKGKPEKPEKGKD